MEKRTAVIRPAKFETRERTNDAGQKELIIAGYFARFDDIYTIAEYDDYTLTESVDSAAFRLDRDKDVRALNNHDAKLVIGRTTNGTLTLRTDETGLYGEIVINPNDTDATNLYYRVQRGDVSQCSFGFFVKDYDETRTPRGWHRTLKDVELFEVSACTFPAYEMTNIQARAADTENLKRRVFDEWKANTRAKHDWLKEKTNNA